MLQNVIKERHWVYLFCLMFTIPKYINIYEIMKPILSINQARFIRYRRYYFWKHQIGKLEFKKNYVSWIIVLCKLSNICRHKWNCRNVKLRQIHFSFNGLKLLVKIKNMKIWMLLLWAGTWISSILLWLLYWFK